jgi:hypothetical protein
MALGRCGFFQRALEIGVRTDRSLGWEKKQKIEKGDHRFMSTGSGHQVTSNPTFQVNFMYLFFQGAFVYGQAEIEHQ